MQGEDLGKVEEVMLDVENGCVSYVVLSHGGFLGMGDKLFAVPWNALDVDIDNHELVLDISRERFENAPGFDKSEWPDFSSEEYGGQIHEFYGLDRPSWYSSSRIGQRGGMSRAESEGPAGSYGVDYEPEGTERPLGSFGDRSVGDGRSREDFELMDCDEAGLTEEERIRCREQRRVA
jgi:hypothetical protein